MMLAIGPKGRGDDVNEEREFYNTDTFDGSDDDSESDSNSSSSDSSQNCITNNSANIDSDSSPSNYDQGDGAFDRDCYTGHNSPLKHEGCINTATWLEDWRVVSQKDLFSSNNTGLGPVKSNECSTQIMTSGDDRVVKIWDVSGYMGSICDDSEKYPCSREMCTLRYQESVGGASLLATLSTGHTMNIFHLSSIPGNPGKICTCGADGYLRMEDCESSAISSHGLASNQASTVIVSPLEERDNLFYHDICFSHDFLDEKTGLLCTESRGLFLFDIRLPPSRQVGTLSLEGNFTACKACAILSPRIGSALPYVTGDGVDFLPSSTYCLVGGTSSDVMLFDIRALSTGDTPMRTVLKYRPSSLNMYDDVSVSGIDISKDGKEFLVSYESDTIYSFPLSSTNIELGVERNTSNDCVNQLSETACYGGHLNHLTFLKAAKFAGPNDEYIVTGSDSGHAWIYDRNRGSVVSFLKADSTTCNGVIPHKRLPIFVTYGIDSTAKLWRAASATSDSFQDSLEDRYITYQNTPYEKSPIVSDWCLVQKKLNYLIEGSKLKVKEFYPDNVPNFRKTRGGISNAIQDLPKVLQHNLWCCIDSNNMKSGIPKFSARLSNIRLRHFAFMKGIKQDSNMPWMVAEHPHISSSTIESNIRDDFADYPSDWLQFDALFTENPKSIGFGDRQDRYSPPTIAAPYSKLHDVITLLKSNGNIAVKQQKFNFAASLYDKAIRYCAMIFMNYPCGDLVVVSKSGKENSSWSPFVKLLVSCRLNLALAMQMKDISDWKGSIEQAQRVLSELKPFICTNISGDDLSLNTAEYIEVKEFQAKALFRLGCAWQACSQYQEAMKSFQNSVKVTREIKQGEVENVVLRRLAETKRLSAKQKNKRRKKYKAMFA